MDNRSCCAREVWIGKAGGIQCWDFMDCCFPCLKSLLWEQPAQAGMFAASPGLGMRRVNPRIWWISASQGAQRWGFAMPDTGSCGSYGVGMDGSAGSVSRGAVTAPSGHCAVPSLSWVTGTAWQSHSSVPCSHQD